MSTKTRTLATGAAASEATRWVQLIIGIICMVMIANLQYGWNLFVDPIDQKYHWGRAAIQVAFTLFVVTETWLVPIEGWFVDRFGPKIVVLLGGVLVAIAWVINSKASSLLVLYTAAVISGIGAGAVSGTCVGNALKWFADRRGLAVGLTVAGFGAGAALTVVPIAQMIKANGYEAAFLWFGLGQGLMILILSQFLKAPQPGEVSPAPPRLSQTSRHYMPQETLRTPLFWVMYIMFVLVAARGLMITAQLASIAVDFGVANTPVTILGITAMTPPFALAVDNVLNGLGRPFFGWISDQIGREDGHGALRVSVSLGKRDRGDLHDAPQDVKDGWDRHSEEEQQKRVVQNLLHERNFALRCGWAGRTALGRCHGRYLPGGGFGQGWYGQSTRAELTWVKAERTKAGDRIVDPERFGGASSRGGVHLVTLRPVATINLIAAAVALTAVAVLASRNGDPNSDAGPSVTLIYVGADDCAPCRTWYRDQWPKFRASREFERLEYRAVESPNLLDVLKDEHWPDDLRAYRKEIDAGSGVPMWLVVSQNEIVLKASGVSKWNEAVFPAVQRLVR